MSETTKVVLADDDESVLSLLESVFTSYPEEFEVVGLAQDGQQAVDLAASTGAEVYLLDVRMPRLNGLSACREIRKLHPDAVVLMISALGDEDFVREATAAGAKDYLVKPFKIEALLETVRQEILHQKSRIQALSEAPKSGRRKSKTWAFWSPRSGVGVTSLAINMALEVVRANQTTVYLDLDFVFPDSEQLLGLAQMFNLSDLILEDSSLDSGRIRSSLESHTSGLRCLYQHDPGLAGVVGESHVRELIWALEKEYSYLVLDVPPDLGGVTGVALEMADTIWLVAGPDPLAARNITKALGLFHQLGLPREKFQLLLNRVDRRSEDLLRALLPDTPVAVFQEDTKVFHDSMRTACPAILSHPHSGFGKEVKRLVSQSLALSVTDAPEPPAPSLKDRFLSLWNSS